jgi:hypothetical protein
MEGLRSRETLDGKLPGTFVSPELKADTARFLEEVKTRVHLRIQPEPPSHTNPSRRERP